MQIDVFINENKKLWKSIEATEIQAGSNNKSKSSQFISFLLLIGKFSHFK